MAVQVDVQAMPAGTLLTSPMTCTVSGAVPGTGVARRNAAPIAVGPVTLASHVAAALPAHGPCVHESNTAPASGVATSRTLVP